MSSKLTTKIPERRQWRSFDVFLNNFEHILHLLLYFYSYFERASVATGAGKSQKIIRYRILYLEVSTVTKKQTYADPLWETSGI